jgi:hypothetical protein
MVYNEHGVTRYENEKTTVEMSSQAEFQIGFWHPFGPHGDEGPDQILRRKRQEIAANGWTLWSFQHRKCLEQWHAEIMNVGPRVVLIFCAESRDAHAPTGERKRCTHYRPVHKTVKPIPSAVYIPHPMGKKSQGSAFIVDKIIFPVEFSQLPIEWMKKDGTWQTDSLPTRPEYLIRPGNGQRMRPVRAILELKAPYLAAISVNS